MTKAENENTKRQLQRVTSKIMSSAPIFASNFQTHNSGCLTDFEYYLKSAHLTIENISIYRISMDTYYSCLSLNPFTSPKQHFEDLRKTVFSSQIELARIVLLNWALYGFCSG